MSFDLFEKQAFVNAVTPAENPVAFLVGSPLSWDTTGGVAGVDRMCAFIESKVQKLKPRLIPAFAQVILGKSGPELYQTALLWLQANIGQRAVNEVIREAVLGARVRNAGTELIDDGAPVDWHLPAGTIQLAELVCRYPDNFPGPVLTTNFDPLLSLAIRAMGGTPHRRIVDSDGNIGRAAESEAGTRTVAHLHGYWRAGDTLHTPAQLTANRPRLKASIQSLLRTKTLVVVAYSGWDDAFTSALADILLDEEARLDVLWCFRESDKSLVAARYARLIEKMQPAISRGVFRAYGGVDCHHVFGEILTEMATGTLLPCPIASSTLDCPLPGWECLDSAALGSMEDLRESEARRYYDGTVPGWRHAMSDLVPRREAAHLISERRSKLDGDSASLQLIRAAGGEGKTTLLLQAAVDAATNEGVRILWRPSPKFSFSPEQLTGLNPEFQWLIVADDAENLLGPVSEAARLLSQAKRANVDFLLAARDSDWKSRGGDRMGWAQWLQLQPDVVLRGLSEADAEAIVEAWAKAGGLRELVKEDADRRPTLLLNAVYELAATSDHKREDGSFFGGLLKVRFGELGLRAHVREFLTQLSEVSIQNNPHSLAEALLYIAACHGSGISGLDENVLADLLGVPREWLNSRVIRPLGEEAAAVSGGGRVFTRHSQVAEAVLLEAEAALDIDLADIWVQVVKQTVRTSDDIDVHYETHSKVIHAGPALQKNLPVLIPKSRRESIAISAAKASIGVLPNRLDVVTDLGKTYRNAGKSDEAVQLFRKELNKAVSKSDFRDSIRSYWFEWGVCEGLVVGGGQYHANVWLAGVALSDCLNPAPITDENVKLICSGLGVPFGKLATRSVGCPFARAHRAVIDIGREVYLNAYSARHFDRHEVDADNLGTARPEGLEEAIKWLTEGVNAARAGAIERRQIQQVPYGQVSFSALRSKLERQKH